MGAGVDLRALLILLVVFTAFLPSSKLEKGTDYIRIRCQLELRYRLVADSVGC